MPFEFKRGPVQPLADVNAVQDLLYYGTPRIARRMLFYHSARKEDCTRIWKERTRLGMVVDLIVVKHVSRLKGRVLIGTQRGAAQDHMGLGEQEQCSDKQHWPCHL